MLARRVLGSSGVHAPILGFGVSGPHATRLVSPSATQSLIRQALAGGASLFDTAPFYGEGEAERRLGAALDGVARDAFTLITKVGTRFDWRRRVHKDFSAAAMRTSVEDSLDRLGVAHVDMVLLHGPTLDHLSAGALQTLAALKTDGLTRLIGVCAREPDVIGHDYGGMCDVMMAPAHVALEEPARAALRRARAHGSGILGIEALTPAQNPRRVPKSPADVWYLARAAKQGTLFQPASLRPSAEACLKGALDGEMCDAVITTTTRSGHLAAALRWAHTLDLPPRGS